MSWQEDGLFTRKPLTTSYSKTNNTATVVWTINYEYKPEPCYQAIKPADWETWKFAEDHLGYCDVCGRVAEYRRYDEDGWAASYYCHEHWVSRNTFEPTDEYRYDNWGKEKLSICS